MGRADKLNAWWERLSSQAKFMVGFGAVVVITLLYSLVGSKGEFSVNVSPIGVLGDFRADTTNTGSKASKPTCKVEAFDVYGNEIGSDRFELGTLEPQEQTIWNGKVSVNEPVAEMKAACD